MEESSSPPDIVIREGINVIVGRFKPFYVLVVNQVLG